MRLLEKFKKTPRERIIVALAMRRSGHHVVVNQLCYQIGSILHLNNCAVWKGKIVPVGTGRLRVYDGKGVLDTGLHPDSRWHKFVTDYQFAAKSKPLSNLLYSFEDADVALNYRRSVEPHRSYATICVVRDPFNWIASSLQHGGLMAAKIGDRISLWKEQVRQCLNPKAYPYGHFVDINYNQWVLDQEYRREVSQRLGLDYSEQGRNEVIDFGPGSSFDRTQYDGKGSEMGVLERWKRFQHDEQYRALAEDPELINLSEEYFGFVPR